MEARNPLVLERSFLRVFTRSEDIEVLEYEGEADLSEKQRDRFKHLLGTNRGTARITVSKTLGFKSFGKGGEVMLSVSADCLQEATFMAAMSRELGGFLDQQLEEHVDALKKKMQEHGLTDADGNIVRD